MVNLKKGGVTIGVVLLASLIMVGVGTLIAFVFVDDFIDGLMLVLEKGEHMNIYNIGTMDEISIKQVAIEVGKYFGKEVKIIPGKEAKGGTKKRCSDITKLKKLGYEPRVSFEKGLKITAKWYDKNAYKKPKNILISRTKK